MDKVTFGVFRNFRNPTILFFGSDSALEALHRILLSLEEGKNIKLEDDHNFIPLNGIKLTLSLTRSSKGMRIKNMKESAFRWNLSKEDALQNAEKIFSVITSKTPSHNYLESLSDDIGVMVSKGEYPDTFVP